MKDSAEQGHGDLKRSLSNRHIQLIALGGAIGTGLFMGSGKSISLAGPSILFVYMIIGFMLFFVMRAMGEVLLSNLEYKSFIDFAADLLGPWAGFFHRVDVLVVLDCDRYRGCDCSLCVYAVLVP
ncbi:L-asparagine transporter-like permease [Pseudomonas sp. TE3911]